jgi:hypothetical protein
MEYEGQPDPRTLQELGRRIRPLIRDFADQFEASPCIAGICFTVAPAAPRILFAEISGGSVPEPPTGTSYELIAEDPFVQTIEREVEGLLPDMSLSNPEIVQEPLRHTFGNVGGVTEAPIRVYSVPIGSEEAPKDCIFYVLCGGETVEPSMVESIEALRKLPHLLSHLVRQAIFFAGAACETVEEEKFIDHLQGLILERLDAFSTAHRDYLSSVLHPVLHRGDLIRAYQVPEFDYSGQRITEEERRMCESVWIGSRVKLEGRLSGSLRSSGSILLVKIDPATTTGEPGGGQLSARPYPAVIKSADRRSALREYRGLNRLWGYSEDVKRFLTPTPLFFPYRDEQGRTRFAIVTPHISSTSTLGSFAADRWMNEGKIPRVYLFSHIFSEIGSFLGDISGVLPNAMNRSSSPHVHLEQSHFGGAPEAQRRRRKLGEVKWPIFLRDAPRTIKITSQSLPNGPIAIVNPYYIIKNAYRTEGEETIWRSGLTEVNSPIPIAHNDLHAGNVLIKWADDGSLPGLNILDYDYVGEAPSRYYDLATLETSFILSIAEHERFATNSTSGRDLWKHHILPSLVLLWRPYDYADIFENNRFAYDMFNVVKMLVPDLRDRERASLNPHLHACRSVSLLRLTGSHHRRVAEHRIRLQSLLWTAAVYLGLSLRDLVSWSVEDDALAREIDIDSLISGVWG